MLEANVEAENMMQSVVNNVDSRGDCPVSVECWNELDREEVLISSPRAAPNRNELFFPNYASSMQCGIPKHVVTMDEKYVLRCLELIRNYALRAESWRSKIHVSGELSDLMESKARRSFDMVRLGKEGCSIPGTDEVVECLGESAAGGLRDGLNAIDILQSPLLRKFGSIEFDGSNPVYSNVVESLREVRNGSAYELKKEAMVVDRRYASPPVPRRLVSVSSRNSSCSDQPSSSASAVSSQGMLQRTWKDGLPCYVFSVDDKREGYVTSLLKADDKALDYVYTFHSKRKFAKDVLDHELEMESVGSMRVSTSISFCRDNSEVRETQFVLSVCVGDAAAEHRVPNQPQKKNKGLGRRVVNTFKSSQYYKPAKFRSYSAVLEDFPWDPSSEGRLHDMIDPSETLLSHEMAAIIVKEITKSTRQAHTGGWGLKFLKNSMINPSPEPLDQRARSNGECSTSMDILIPAGIHGGPRTGPSSLTDRWISGGRCDCGGWDTGCPLTILNTRSEAGSQDDNKSAQCNTIDLFIKGSKQDVPVLRMVNIHEDLFYIHFQSSLSSLQSFAIAAAIIHSHSLALIGHNS